MFQGQNITYFPNGEDLSNHCLFQPNQEERKIGSPVMQVGQIKQQFAYAIFKKGRPKGDKQSVTKSRKKKNLDEQIPNINMKSGHWCLEENKKYHWFLEIYNSHFMNKHLRRMDKIFKTMATFIGTREAEQCRSHHQKMQKKHNSFCKILLSLRKQNYGSYDPIEIQNDLTANGLSTPNGVLSPFILQQQEKIQNMPVESFLQAQNQFQFQKHINEEKIEIDIVANLFDDEKYEDNLGIYGF